jgi:hypothetical protein
MCPCCPWLVLAPKVLQLCTNHFVWVLCRPVWVSEACQLFRVPSRNSNTPFYPSKCCELRNVPRLIFLSLSSTWIHISILQGIRSASSKEKKLLTRLARALWSQGWPKLWCQLNMQWKYLAIETPKVIQNKFFILCVFVLFSLWILLKLVLIFMCCRCEHSGQKIKLCALHHIISKEVLGDRALTYMEVLNEE